MLVSISQISDIIELKQNLNKLLNSERSQVAHRNAQPSQSSTAMQKMLIHGKNPTGRCEPHFSVAWPLRDNLWRLRDTLWLLRGALWPLRDDLWLL